MKLANHYMLFVFTSLTFFGIVSLIMLKLTQNKSTFLHQKQTQCGTFSSEH